MACFAIDEFETALIAFGKGSALDSSNTQFKTWIRKCEAEIEADEETHHNHSTSESITTTAPSQTVPQPVQTTVPPVQPVQTTVQPIQTVNHQPPVNHTNEESPKVPKYKQDWFQSNIFVEIGLFIKNVKQEQAEINIKEKSISIHIKLLDADYVSEIELFESVIPEDSKIEFLSTKIEINLKKKVPNLKWPSLERSGDNSVISHFDDTTAVNKHAYPSSGKKQVDWDNLAKEIAEDKPEGEEALNKVFQDIFGNGTDEQKKAMIKSFTESGGTVLSTNWDEVGKAKVKGSPPKGMEMHNWEELDK